MFSLARSRLMSIAVKSLKQSEKALPVLALNKSYSHKVETDEEWDARWEAFFKKPTIDGWELRKGLNDMHGYDGFPEPKIVIAALEACKRVNDHSLAVRYLESLKWKAGPDATVIYPWLIQEIRPTLDKLGISTPEELGYDKPELGLKGVFEMRGPNDY